MILNHIARHSELWDDLTDNGIKPLKLLSRMYQDNYGIYENLVFCKTIDDILFFVRRNIRILKDFNYLNQKLEFDLLQRVNHLNYFLALGKLHTGYVRNFDKYSVVSKHCLNGLENIYNTLVPRLKQPVYRKNKSRPKKIKKTNILAMHRDYKHIYSLEKYFMNNKIVIEYDFNQKKYEKFKKNYFGFCTILSIFSIGHFNFKCSESVNINYNRLNMVFNYKNWKLTLKHESAGDYKAISIILSKDKDYKLILIPIIDEENKEVILSNVKKSLKGDEYKVCFPYEKNEYFENEMCIDISNLESFRRIQQWVLKAMIYSDTLREDCPFCDNSLIKGHKKGTYECEGCRTLIADAVCEETNEAYSYTDIINYEREMLELDRFKDEEWLYYRKKESILHFRNITSLDDEGNVVCPLCHKIHQQGE